MADSMAISFIIGATLASGFTAAFKAANAATRMMASVAAKANAKEKDLAKQSEDLNRIWESGRISVEHHKEALEQLASQMKKVKATQATVAKQTELDRQFESYGQKRNETVSNIMKAGAAAYAMSLPVQDAVDMESSMSDVAKVVNMTDEEFADMENSIIEMSTRIPMTAKGIASIVASAGQAGIAKGELLKFANDAAQMGIAFDVTAEQAGDMMAKWRTAFKMGQSDVVALADKINYLSNNTASTAAEISDVVSRIGPLGEVGGVASGEIAALGASMVGASVQTDVAATGIKNLILGMTAGAGATKSQAAAFEAMGLDAVDMSEKMQDDAKGAITEVLTELSKLGKAQQANVLSDLFGKESIGAIAPLLSNLDNLKLNFQRVGDSSQYSGSMLAEYTARTKTAKNSMELLTNAGEAASIMMGDAMLPALKELSAELLPVVKSIAGFIKENKGAVTAAAELAGGFTGIYIATNLFLAAYNLIQQGVTGIRGLFNGAKIAIIAFKDGQIAAAIATRAYAVAARVAQAAQWLFNAALSANPIGLVIAGLFALGAAIYWCYNHFEQVQAFCASMWESPAAAIIAFLTGPIGWLIYIGAGIIANWDKVKQWFTLLWDDPSAAIEQFKNFVSSKLDELYNKAQEIWKSIKDVFKDPIQAVVNFIKGGDNDAASVAEIPTAHNASGGIYGKGAFLTTFAEDSPEAAIPINGTTRAINLWQKTGEMLGVMPKKKERPFNLAGIRDLTLGTSRNTSRIEINYNPQITITGNADAGTIRQELADDRTKLEEMLKSILHDRRRLSYE